MKISFFPVALAVLLLSSPIVHASPAQPPPANGEEQAVQRFVDDFAAAFSANDANAVDRLTTPDYTFVTPAGGVQSAEQRIAPLRSGDLKYESVKYDEVKIQIYGDAAVVTARVTVKSHLKGVDIGGLFRSTLTLIKNQGEWRLVASQASAIAQP